MRQNATGTKCGERDLSPQQTRVLAGLLEGKTISAAADAAAIDRTTVHRWLRDDFAFQAAYNGLRRHLRQQVQTRLEHLAQAALETVSAAVSNGDVRTAIAVLRGTGLLAGEVPAIGPEDPGEVAAEAEVTGREREALRAQRRLLAF